MPLRAHYFPHHADAGLPGGWRLCQVNVLERRLVSRYLDAHIDTGGTTLGREP